MELGLSLGGDSGCTNTTTSSQALELLTKKNNTPERHGGNTTVKTNGNSIGFCMALGIGSTNGIRQSGKANDENSHESDGDDEHTTSEEVDVEDDEEEDEEQGRRRRRHNLRKSTGEAVPTSPPVQLDLLPLAPVPRQVIPWSSDNGSSDNGSSGNVGLLPAAAARGFDVNKLPAGAAMVVAGDEVSSPNSVASSFHMDFNIFRASAGNMMSVGRNNKRDFEATGNDAGEAERASSRASDEDENGLNARKKLRLSKEQSAYLEESFKEHNTLNPKQKLALAKQLNLRPRQVEVWFQNRRARTKLKQTEVDCEYLKRCCETLTEENRRLHKELQELRALKTSNPFYMQLPATTLTMCPSCERVATTSTAPNTTSTATTTTATPNTKNSTITAAATDSTPKAIPFPISRPRFYPFSHTPATQSHQPAAT